MNVRPAGREACECASPINQILERLDQMDADIASAQQAANTAVGTATAQAGAAAASAASAQADAAAALINAGAAQQAADDAHDEAVAAAGSAQDAADDAADALLALQNIESTIASVLATDIGAKVDKLTTAGFHLYSHNGSTQGEVAPDINPTAATIPIRDSSGKLFGADPASGATDKTLTTANWVSQTGNSAPNNLVHRLGNEDVNGEKTLLVAYNGQQKPYKTFGSNTTPGWYAITKIPKSNQCQGMFVLQAPGNYNIILTNTSSSAHGINVIKYVGSYTPNRNAFLLAEVSDGYILYAWSPTYRTNIFKVDYFGVYGMTINYKNQANLDDSVYTGQPETTKPAVGGDILAIYDENYLQEVTT